MIPIQLLIIKYLCVLFLIVALYLFVMWPKTKKFSLSSWQILTLLIFSILINQLVGSYEAYTIIYFVDAIILFLILVKVIGRRTQTNLTNNELSQAITKIEKMSEKAFEKFIISLLKKYSFQSINKFDVKDDEDNISDSYLLAQREGTFYEIRTFTTKKELSEKHISRITNKFRDSPTQIDNRILFINSLSTDHVKHLIDNSGITLNTIDSAKIRELINIVEPQPATQSHGLKANLAKTIDSLTHSLNVLKIKLVGNEATQPSGKTVEQALSETIFTENNKTIPNEIPEQSETAVPATLNIVEPAPEPPLPTLTIDTEEPTNHKDEESTSEHEVQGPISNEDSDDKKEDDTQEDISSAAESPVDTQPETTDDQYEGEQDNLMSEDELNEIEIAPVEDFNFDSSITGTVNSKIDIDELDDFPTDNTSSDADLFGDSSSKDESELFPTPSNSNETTLNDDELLNPTVHELEKVSESEPLNESSINAVPDADDKLLNPTSEQVKEQENPQTSDNTEPSHSDKISESSTDIELDESLALMLTAQNSSQHLNNCAQFDQEGTSIEDNTPSQILTEPPHDSLHVSVGITEDDLRAISLLDNEIEVENEISLSANTQEFTVKMENTETKDSTFKTASDDDLLAPSSTTQVLQDTDQPKKKRTRRKNKGQ